MNAFISELSRIVKLSLGNPESTVQTVVLLVLAILAAAGVILLVGEHFGCRMVNSNRLGLLLLIGIPLLLAVATLTGLYVSPCVSQPVVRQWLPAATVVIVFLAAVIPLARWFLKAGYFQALFTLLLSVVAAAGLVALVHAALGAAFAGGDSIEKAKQRAERLRQIPR